MAHRVQGACVDIGILVMGIIDNNVYLISDGTATIVVDPSCHEDEILEALDGRTVDAIVLTHAHWDHVGAAAALQRATGAQVIASAVDAPVIESANGLGPEHMRFEPCEVTRKVNDGDIVVALHGKLKRGDVVAFYYNNTILIKRVIATEGQWVNIDEDGTVYVDGKPLEEPYLSEKAFGETNIELPYQVPDARYFVMGDHRSTSIDSRNTAVGCVSDEMIIGRIYLRVWPLKDFGAVR